MNFLSPDQLGSMFGGRLSDQDIANLYNTAAANNDFSMFMPKRPGIPATPAPAVVNPAAAIPQQWPVFRNEMERNIAVDTGAYDPSYPTPMAKAAAIAAEAARTRDSAAYSLSQRKAFPLTADLSPEGTLQAQLAGDQGDTKRVLQSLQKINPEQELLLPPEKRTSLMPFYPKTGIGGAPSEEAMSSKLELKLFNDPEFSRLYTSNPKKAAYVYESLTGRPLAGDIESNTNINKTRAKIGTDFVARELGGGAKFDPETGKWMLWQRTAPDSNTSFGMGPQNPVTRQVEATPEQAQYFKDYYKNVTGYDLPQARTTPERRMAQARRDMADYEFLGSKERKMYDDRIIKEESIKGSPLTRDEKRAVLDNVLSMGPQGTVYKAAEMGEGFRRWLFGDPFTEQQMQQAEAAPRTLSIEDVIRERQMPRTGTNFLPPNRPDPSLAGFQYLFPQLQR